MWAQHHFYLSFSLSGVLVVALKYLVLKNVATLLRLFLPKVYRPAELYPCVCKLRLPWNRCDARVNFEKKFENFINLKLLFKVHGEIQPRDNYVFAYFSL